MTENKSKKLPKRPVDEKFSYMREAKRMPTTSAAAPKTPQPTKKVNKK